MNFSGGPARPTLPSLAARPTLPSLAARPAVILDVSGRRAVGPFCTSLLFSALRSYSGGKNKMLWWTTGAAFLPCRDFVASRLRAATLRPLGHQSTELKVVRVLYVAQQDNQDLANARATINMS